MLVLVPPAGARLDDEMVRVTVAPPFRSEKLCDRHQLDRVEPQWYEMLIEQPHGVGEISFPTVAKTKRTDVQHVNHEILHAARHCQPGREFIRRLPQLPEWRQSIALLYMRESCFVGQNGNEGGVADYSL